MSTQTRVYKPLVGISSLADLEGTILGGEARSRPYIGVKVPVGFLCDMVLLRIYREFLPIQIGADGTPIIGTLHRAADNLVQTAQDHAINPTSDSELRLREAMGVYRRSILRELIWDLGKVANPRDSRNTSSAYLVGVPYLKSDAFLTGDLSDLPELSVALHPRTARELGVSSGDVVLLRRFPETACAAVRVVISKLIPRHVLGLPLGDLMQTLGGDLDGDCYVIQNFFTQECRDELLHMYARQFLESETKTSILGYWNETPSDLTDEQVSDSKRKQKVLVGPNTIDSYSNFMIKLMARDRLPLTYEQLRQMGERAIEVVMDTKKAPVHSDGTLWDPMLLRKFLNAEETGCLDASEVEAKLEEQGYCLEDIHTLMAFSARYEETLRSLAYRNPAYKLLASKQHQDVEDFLRGLKKSDGLSGVAAKFEDCLFARHLIEPGMSPKPAKLSRSSRKFGFRGFKAVLVQDGISVACGLGRHTQETRYGGRAINISPNGTEVAMFRATVEVILNGAECLARSLDKKVEALTAKGLTDEAERLSSCYGRMDSSLCLFHRNWAELLEALAESPLFSFDVATIIREPNALKASELLSSLVRRMLRRMYKTYQVSGGDFRTWSSLAGAHKIVVVNFEKEMPEGLDPFSAKMRVGEVAGKFLKERGLVNALSDTISGDPGTAYYRKAGPTSNYVTKFDPLSHMIPFRRMSVSAAMGNLVEMAGATPPSYKYAGDRNHRPPTREVWAIGLPFDLKDAVVVSPELAATLKAKVPKVLPNLDFGSYELYGLETGCKVQSFVDAKGVAVVRELPMIEFADGTRVAAEVGVPMVSTSHGMLTHTHGTMAVTAAAHRMVTTTGYRLSIPKNVTIERISRVAKASGLYADDSLTARLVDPRTGEYLSYQDPSTGTSYEFFPAGRIQIGMHSQIPEVISSVHSRETDEKTYLPSSTADGGVVSGIAGAFCLAAHGAWNCIAELHSSPNQALSAKIDALANALVWSDTSLSVSHSDIPLN